MTDQSNNSKSTPQEINISPRVIKFFEIFNGAQINTDQVKKINIGEWDYVIGPVILENYQPAVGSTILTQVALQTYEGKKITFSDNQYYKFDKNITKILKNAYLINRSEIIYITSASLAKFKDNFQNAAKYKQIVACAYDRITAEIVLTSIYSHEYSASNNKYSKSSACPGWNCGGTWPP